MLINTWLDKEISFLVLIAGIFGIEGTGGTPGTLGTPGIGGIDPEIVGTAGTLAIVIGIGGTFGILGIVEGTARILEVLVEFIIGLGVVREVLVLLDSSSPVICLVKPWIFLLISSFPI
jgi:hypothetical protein